MAVELDAFFFDIGEEVSAFGNHLPNVAERMVDYAVRSFEVNGGGDSFFHAVVKVGVFGGFLRFGGDEDIEVGFVNVGGMAFGMGVFDPVSAGIAAEEDEHSDIGDFFEDDVLYQL